LRPCRYVITLLLALSLIGCASEPPRLRGQVLVTLARVRAKGGETKLPAEFRSTVEAYRKAESLLTEKEREESERYFCLALLKAGLMEQELAELKARQEEEARLAQEKKRAEEEQKAREEADRQAQAQAQTQLQKEAVELSRRKPKPQKEHPLVSSYTVRRGESLPLIAAQPEVYGDRSLWPLIYRANRAQIRDPRHIWPGQVLRVPRNVGGDDIAEARRYAQERPLH
jgi:nucleoid-associated protein YgaU